MRKYIDCREVPSEGQCTVAISADTEDELMEAAVQHAIAVHKHADTPELRAMIRGGIHEGEPSHHALRDWWQAGLGRLLPAERLTVVGRGFTRHRPRV
jgi:predicted small metal-binding protein